MSKVTTLVRAVRDPAQPRSRQTLNRLLDAAEALLGDRTFDELTVSEVVRRAKSSVGSFYARFPDKEALLGAIYERHQQQMIAQLDEELSVERWAGVPLAVMIERIVDRLVRLYRSQRGLLRALVLFGYTHPDWRYADERERGRLAVSRIAELIAERRRNLTHADPARVASLGVLSVLATLREAILFSESTSSAVQLSDERLAKELSIQLCTYLGVIRRAHEADIA